MKEITVEECKLMNPFTCCGKDWFTVNAVYDGKGNALTASWGGFGRVWNKDVVTIYIRPQRYTRQFIDKSNEFTISFLEDGHRMALSFLGSTSGKDCVDKLAESSLHPCMDGSVLTFEEAELTIHCKVLYRQQLDPSSFLDQEIMMKNYPNKDYSIIYIGEITKIYQR